MSLGLICETRAQIFLTVDSAIELSGSFSETGFDFSSSSPVNFASLPAGGAQTVYAARFPNNVLQSLGTGTPADPRYNFAIGTGLATLTGTYSNGGIGGDQVVNWSFSNMVDNGTTFSGNFSFTAVPEPAETAAMIGLGLGAFAWARRNRKTAAR